MSRMLDLIRSSKLSYHQMNTAARGALHVPTAEMVEILVYLAEHNKIFADTARLTLASWDEEQSKIIAADPHTAKEVLNYWLTPNNIRPALFQVFIENPSVPMSKLSELAGALKGELLDVIIASARVRSSVQVLQDLAGNHHLSGAQAARVQALIEGNTGPSKTIEAEAAPPISDPKPAPANEQPEGTVSAPEIASPEVPQADDPEAESALVAFFAEHAKEIAAEGEKPFQPIGGIHEELPADTEAKAAAAAASGMPTTTVTPSANPKPPTHKKLTNPQDEQRGSTLQKIAKLDVKGRIQLAVKGTKEERSILVRDGTKIVALAVLDSPKITDGEVEKFAAQKNVLEAVLRSIPMKRRFAKNYAIVRNLVFNPRTPLDVALGLMKNLLTADLRHLSGNKEVPETVRKLALRMFKQKSETKKE